MGFLAGRAGWRRGERQRHEDADGLKPRKKERERGEGKTKKNIKNWEERGENIWRKAKEDVIDDKRMGE